MTAVSVFHADREEEKDKGEFQGPPNISFGLTLSKLRVESGEG